MEEILEAIIARMDRQYAMTEDLLQGILVELKAINIRMDREHEMTVQGQADAEDKARAHIESLKAMMPTNMHAMFDQLMGSKS